MTFGDGYTNICSMPVACAIVPRFQLLAAVGSHRETLDRHAALAPEPGAAQLIGEVSGPAERLGVRQAESAGQCVPRRSLGTSWVSRSRHGRRRSN